MEVKIGASGKFHEEQQPRVPPHQIDLDNRERLQLSSR